MDGRGRKIHLRDLNAHLICVLCGGYYIDATSISECLHTCDQPKGWSETLEAWLSKTRSEVVYNAFLIEWKVCKSCIVKYLETNKFCPICDVQLHKAKPLLSIRPDKTLQRLVYKMVPGLYSSEMQRRRQFYLNTEIESSTDTDVSCDQSLALNDQQRAGNIYYSPEDSISLSLEYYIGESKSSEDKPEDDDDDDDDDDDSPDNKHTPPRRYLQCPAGVKMYLLKKFLRTKYNLAPDHKVDIIYADECLPDEFSLMDVAYTFMWNRATPMRFRYRIFERTTVKVPATSMGPTTSPQPTVTSDTPDDVTHQRTSQSTTDDDSSSKGQQFYGDRRRLRESDSEAESSSFRQKRKIESRNKEKSEPLLKKLRINSKKTKNFLKKKTNSSFKSPKKNSLALKNCEVKKSSSDNVKYDSEIVVNKNAIDCLPVDDSAMDTTDKDAPSESKTEILDDTPKSSNEILDTHEDFILRDQQMENDDLEEDDEDRLRISASEEDVTQEDRNCTDAVEEPVKETPSVSESLKRNDEKQEEMSAEQKKEAKRETKDSKEVEFKVRKKNKKAKHHHHHRHHDRKRDHPPPPAATILHSPDMKNDIMKLKVKLTAVKPDDQSKYYHKYNSHSPTRHHNSKHKTAYVVSDDNEKPTKQDISNGNENSGNLRVTENGNAASKNSETARNQSKDSPNEENTLVSKSKKEQNCVSILNNKQKNNSSSNNISSSSNKNNNNNNNNSSNSKNENCINKKTCYNNNNDKNKNNNNNNTDSTKSLNDTNSSSLNKEKLLQMRAIRHKSVSNPKELEHTYIVKKDEEVDENDDDMYEEDYEDDIEEITTSSTILIPPSSITVSKITAAEKRKMEEEKLLMMSGKHNGNGLDSKRPSLEIMLVNAPVSKNNMKPSVQDDRSNEKQKSIKGPPPSIPLVRIQKPGGSSLPCNRQSMVSMNSKINNNNNASNNHSNKTNKSSFSNKTLSGNAIKDNKSKQRANDEVKTNHEKFFNSLNKSKTSGSGDDFGALDLSDKSSRKGSSSASSTSSENSNCPSPNSTTFPIMQNSVQRQYSSLHNSPGSIGRSPSSSPPQICTAAPKNSPEPGLSLFPPSMRNLLTLSDTAVHIRDMMTARDGSKPQLPSPNSQKRSPQRYSAESSPSSKSPASPRAPIPSATQLKIPVPNSSLNHKALANKNRTGAIPNLNEIGTGNSIGRGKLNYGLQNNRTGPISKPVQNQTVRHIPNPSVLLFRQNQMKNMSQTVSPGPMSPNKKFMNGRGPNMPPPPPAIPLSSLRRMESMTRNIEKVAAGLSVKAAVEAGYGSVK